MCGLVSVLLWDGFDGRVQGGCLAAVSSKYAPSLKCLCEVANGDAN